jgi:hypothetical protein
MINSLAAFITTALGLVAFFVLVNMGLTTKETSLTVVVVLLVYQSFKARGRIDDLEERVGK